MWRKEVKRTEPVKFAEMESWNFMVAKIVVLVEVRTLKDHYGLIWVANHFT